MGRQAIIGIKESVEELDYLYKKSRKHKVKLRIKSLILTKTQKFPTREKLAEHLGINVKTLYVWTKTYTTQGLSTMLNSTSGGKHNYVVSNTIKEGLEEKLRNSNNPLQGYTDAVEWVKNNYDLEINYHTLRSFMIVNFGTKLKMPRKSHYKKDEEAFEAFKKTSKTS